MEKGKIGRHGLGFNSIFNITDLPSILSGELLVQRSVGQCWALVKGTLWLFPLFGVFPGWSTWHYITATEVCSFQMTRVCLVFQTQLKLMGLGLSLQESQNQHICTLRLIPRIHRS